MREYEVWIRHKVKLTWIKLAYGDLDDVMMYLVEFNADTISDYDGFRIETYKDN